MNADGEYITTFIENYQAQNLLVNKDVDDDLFTAKGVFLSGTPVADQRIGMNYVYGATLEIVADEMLSEIQAVTLKEVEVDKQEITQESTKKKGGLSPENTKKAIPPEVILNIPSKNHFVYKRSLSAILLLAGFICIIILCWHIIKFNKRSK